jgi:tetraacyldisaccharide 4'-kinase
VRQFNPQALWIELQQSPRHLRDRAGRIAPLNSLQGQPLLAFCGIGNPAAFRRTMASCGFSIIDCVEFGDHHNFTADDWRVLQSRARNAKANALVCTHKDLVKLPAIAQNDLPTWALEIGVQITVGLREFESRLSHYTHHDSAS